MRFLQCFFFRLSGVATPRRKYGWNSGIALVSLAIILVETFAVEGLLWDKVLVSFQELNISSKNSKVNQYVIVRCPVVSVKQ